METIENVPTKRVYTLLYLNKGAQVLLGLKKRGFGKGKWNGFGGKVEPGETVLQAAIREMREETGLTVQRVEKVGVVNYYTDGIHDEVHVYATSESTGLLVETDEMLPRWFDINDIPFSNMWMDQKYWLHFVFQRKLFKCHFWYTDVQEEKMVDYKIEMVQEL